MTGPGGLPGISTGTTTAAESSGNAGQPAPVAVGEIAGTSAAGAPMTAGAASEGMSGTLQQINEHLAHLAQAFDAKIKYDDVKDQQIARLHGELESYRNGLHLALLRPILNDLIAMYDDLGQFISHHRETLPENVVKTLGSFQSGILETMRRNGIEFYQESAPTFNSERQRVSQPVDTADPSQDRLIARRVRPGFVYEGRVIRHELVDVYRFVAR